MTLAKLHSFGYSKKSFAVGQNSSGSVINKTCKAYSFLSAKTFFTQN